MLCVDVAQAPAPAKECLKKMFVGWVDVAARWLPGERSVVSSDVLVISEARHLQPPLPMMHCIDRLVLAVLPHWTRQSYLSIMTRFLEKACNSAFQSP